MGPPLWLTLSRAHFHHQSLPLSKHQSKLNGPTAKQQSCLPWLVGAHHQWPVKASLANLLLCTLGRALQLRLASLDATHGRPSASSAPQPRQHQTGSPLAPPSEGATQTRRGAKWPAVWARPLASCDPYCNLLSAPQAACGAADGPPCSVCSEQCVQQSGLCMLLHAASRWSLDRP